MPPLFLLNSSSNNPLIGFNLRSSRPRWVVKNSGKDKRPVQGQAARMANVVFPLKATRQKTWGPFKNLVFCVLCKTLYKNSHKVYKWDKVKINRVGRCADCGRDGCAQRRVKMGG
jgi:hypothetical protein